MDLRLLGLWKGIPLAALTRATVPIAASGFVVAATTGAGLLSANATEYAGNPFLLDQVHSDSAWASQRDSDQPPAGVARARIARAVRERAAATRCDGRHFADVLADGRRGGTDDCVLVIVTSCEICKSEASANRFTSRCEGFLNGNRPLDTARLHEKFVHARIVPELFAAGARPAYARR